MEYVPIVMFVYNREDHFIKTYEALAKCPEAKNSLLYIFSDGAKNERSEPQVRRVRETAKRLAGQSDFHKIILSESPVNMGLAKSVIQGVTMVLNKYGKAIIIEDDNIASPHLLDFFNRALAFYEKDKTVGALSGYTPLISFPDNYRQDVFSSYRSCSCCWATWKDSWQNIDWELKGFSDFVSDKQAVKKFTQTGNDRLIRLYRQTKGNGTSWSVRFGAHLVQQNLQTIYPRYSYIMNIGYDASGTHSRQNDAKSLEVDLSKAIPNPRFETVTLNKDIQKRLKKHYSGGKKSDIKRFCAVKYIIYKEKRKKSV